MSIDTEITRIQTAAGTIRSKLVNMGRVSSTATLSQCVTSLQGITVHSGGTIMPGTTNQTIASGNYLKEALTCASDSNLIASNIKSGVTIFGVTGTFAPVDLYNAGDECSSITGGWVAKKATLNDKFTGTLPTLTKYDTYMNVRGTVNGQTAGFSALSTSNVIDLSSYNALYFTIGENKTYMNVSPKANVFGVASKSSTAADTINITSYTASTDSNTTIGVDISSISSGCIAIGVYSLPTSSLGLVYNISRIWLE